VERLAISQPAVSKHLRVLREAGLVTVRPDRQLRLYSIRPEPLIELDSWLEPYREMWRNSLDKLEEHLAKRQPPARRKRPCEATLLKSGDRQVLRFERHLSRSVEEVWQAITDTSEMRSWFPTRIEIDEWKVGAELTHHFEQASIDPLPGRVIEWDPPRRVSVTWGTDTIAFELSTAADAGTVFVLTEELSANHAARNAAGWRACLDRLQLGAERESWKHRFLTADSASPDVKMTDAIQDHRQAL
jgi:uncharacterized protein YndB with AHSA1/START domain